MLKKDVAKLFLSTIAATFFAACGDDTTTEKIVEVAGGTVIVESVGDLPECTKDIEGERAWVKTESTDRICVDGKWFATKDSLNAGDFSCATKELKDKSGIKIVCNGDSIGVVLNGSDGKDGKAGTSGKDGDDGAGCAVVDQTDSTVVVKCGDQSITLNLGSAADNDSVALDSEKIAIPMGSVIGFAQKGPFLKGSTIYLYELSDGHSLKQTGDFVSTVTKEDGQFMFTSGDLMSQYALIVVDGKYYNEVTGKLTSTEIFLQAYTDLLNSNNANVNVLTHLEKNRVYYLVTHEKKRFNEAKRQAQLEIFNAFHFDTTKLSMLSEDLNIFGPTDAEAALLAISILLQGDDDESALSVLLSEIVQDMESDGEWNDSAKRARIADWAATADTAGRFAEFRRNIESWMFPGIIPYFEKVAHKFWSEELGLGVCGDKDNPVGTVKHVSNPNSARFYAKEYTDVTSAGKKIRFICVDDNGTKWRVAKNIEKDTVGWGNDYSVGDVKNGKVNSNLTYVYEDGSWRLGTNLDSIFVKHYGGSACVKDDTTSFRYKNEYYVCTAQLSGNTQRKWIVAPTKYNDTQDSLAECQKGRDGRYGDGTILAGIVNAKNKYVCDADTFRVANDREKKFNKGCSSNNKDMFVVVDESEFAEYGYMCEAGNNFTTYMIKRDESKFGTLIDKRNNRTYYTIKIGNQVWMAENLDFEYKVDGVTYGNYCNSDDCKLYGRYYTWAAAMDSAGVYSKNSKGCGYGMTCSPAEPVRGICPEGWHLPSSSEWDALNTAVGTRSNALQAKKIEEWYSATDAYGFSALPAGYYDDGVFVAIGGQARFWGANERTSSDAWNQELHEQYIDLYCFGGKTDGKSVRCVQNDPVEP